MQQHLLNDDLDSRAEGQGLQLSSMRGSKSSSWRLLLQRLLGLQWLLGVALLWAANALLERVAQTLHLAFPSSLIGVPPAFEHPLLMQQGSGAQCGACRESQSYTRVARLGSFQGTC